MAADDDNPNNNDDDEEEANDDNDDIIEEDSLLPLDLYQGRITPQQQQQQQQLLDEKRKEAVSRSVKELTLGTSQSGSSNSLKRSCSHKNNHSRDCGDGESKDQNLLKVAEVCNEYEKRCQEGGERKTKKAAVGIMTCSEESTGRDRAVGGSSSPRQTVLEPSTSGSNRAICEEPRGEVEKTERAENVAVDTEYGDEEMDLDDDDDEDGNSSEEMGLNMKIGRNLVLPNLASSRSLDVVAPGLGDSGNSARSTPLTSSDALPLEHHTRRPASHGSREISAYDMINSRSTLCGLSSVMGGTLPLTLSPVPLTSGSGSLTLGPDAALASLASTSGLGPVQSVPLVSNSFQNG